MKAAEAISVGVAGLPRPSGEELAMTKREFVGFVGFVGFLSFVQLTEFYSAL